MWRRRGEGKVPSRRVDASEVSRETRSRTVASVSSGAASADDPVQGAGDEGADESKMNLPALQPTDAL
jgi:hypothetical protein